MKFKEYISLLSKDRDFIIAALLGYVVLVAIIIMGVVQIRPSDLQIPVRYTSFGFTNFYRDKWFYEVAFIAFALFLTAIHSVAGAKLYLVKGRTFAIAFMWLTAGLLTISGLTILAILRVVSFSQ